MKRRKALGLISGALLLLGGCDDSTTSPCYDCGSDDRYSETVERVFSAAENPLITVNNFTGRVVFRTGAAGSIRVVATRRAERHFHLDRIEIAMSAHQSGLDIHTDNPDRLKNVAVDLVITAPPGATPRLHTAVGDIAYRGRPKGNCRFWSAVGSIRLELPSDVNISFELQAAVGAVHIDSPFADAVWSEPGVIHGRIGSGDEGHVLAGAAVGSIHLLQR